jgi:hypothetical protein
MDDWSFQRRAITTTGSPVNAEAIGLRHAGPWHVTRSDSTRWAPICGTPFDGDRIEGGKEVPYRVQACEKCMTLVPALEYR